MEEELNYSTVVFKNGDKLPKETNEDSTIYSTVKSEKGPNTTANTVQNAEAATHPQHFKLLVVCFGILCVLLLLSISVIIYISVVMNDQKINLEARIYNLTAENQQLLTNGSILQNETDNLSWMLRVIMKFNTFPVTVYCPQKKCQPCQSGWIQFQGSCYFFYNELPPWKTWKQSRQYCQNTAADLVVIDNPQEQEFVSNLTKYYYDTCHGYWLGLSQTAENWVWADGRNGTFGYWMTQPLGTSDKCALMIPSGNFTANWNPADCKMQNKLICETEVLIRSN